MKLYNAHQRLKKLVDSVTATLDLLKKADTTTMNAKTKKLLDDYVKKVDDFRSTLLASKQKSIFADERKLREEISETYVTLCYKEEPISNLEKESVTRLLGKVAEAETNGNKLLQEVNEKVKTTLEKKPA
jgi:hypothetical protein